MHALSHFEPVWQRAFLWLLLLGCNIADSSHAEDPPLNIVLILADDLGWSDLGCYGNELHQTPRIDELAEQSVRYTQAYAASPVCTPTRASILTGRHPARLHMTIWREASQERGQRTLLEPITNSDLPLSEVTLAERLRQVSYRTIHVGKWHLGGETAYPETQGFEWNIGGTGWGAPNSFSYPFRGDQYFKDFRYVPGLEPGVKGQYLTDRLTDKAIGILEEIDGQPFFLNLWYHAVHTPIEGKPDLVTKYETLIDSNHRNRNPHYAAMVETLDDNVGRVIDYLKKKNLWERTIFVVLSDNGGFISGDRLHGNIPVTDNWPLRSGKGSCYEGGLRIPMIVHWPGLSKAGVVSDTPVTTCDLLPTLLSGLGQAESDSDSGKASQDTNESPGDLSNSPELDGIDIRKTLDGSESDELHRSLYFHFPHYYSTTTPVSAVRRGDWKLLYYYENQASELFNLRTDPAETMNLAKAEPIVAKELLTELSEWSSRMNAQLPEPNNGDR